MNDDLKYTIMSKIKKELNISVVDTPNGDKQSDIVTSIYPVLLIEKKADNSNTSFKVINKNTYDKYGTKKNVSLDNVVGLNVFIGNDKNIIEKFDNTTSIITLKNQIKNVFDMITTISIEDTKKEDNNDFIYVYSPYNYSSTMNYNSTTYYRRFNIDIFIYKDEHNDKIEFYTRKLHDLFRLDFNLMRNETETKETVYIKNQLAFNMSEYNLSNKIVRGTILLSLMETNRLKKK